MNASRTLLLSLLCACSMAAAAAGPPAEYAVRWAPSAGGPETVDATVSALGIDAGKSKEYEVQYFDAHVPGDAPAGFGAVLRARTRDGKTEVTWKYRGGTQAPAAKDWVCPLRSEDKRKDELDVSILSTGSVKRAYSRSCTAQGTLSDVAAPELAPTPKGCASTMIRREAKDDSVTVEEWRLADGQVVVEVSSKGPDSKSALKAFRSKFVKKLLAQGVKPLDRSKTEIGSQCSAS